MSWFVISLVAGFVAVYSLPGRDPGGGIIPVILDIIGAIVVLVIYRIVIAKYARTAD